MRFNPSVHVRLTLFIMALVTIVIGLSVIAASSLTAIDYKVEAVDAKWLASTHLIGEWAERVAEFRLAETYRAVASDTQSRRAAELLATEHRRVIASLQAEYVKLHGGETADLMSFRTTWNAYLVEHDAWVKADTEGKLYDRGQLSSALHRLYISANAATDQIGEKNFLAARAEANAIDELIHRTIMLLIAVWRPVYCSVDGC